MTVLMIAAIAIFAIMLLFPLVMSALSARQDPGKALDIDQNRSRNPRYFGLSFAALMEKALERYQGDGSIMISKQETLLLADTMEPESFPEVCTNVVYAAEKSFRPPAGVSFEKEIYCAQNAYLDGIYQLRAIYGKKSVILGEGTKLARWADAEGTVTCYDHCDLGISVSSASELIIGRDCTFRRLYAPAISLGYSFDHGGAQPNQAAAMVKTVLRDNVVRNIRYVDDDHTDEQGILAATIISKHAVSVLEGLTVQGHIRSHKSITIHDGATVCGNLFAEGDIYLGENARVLGNVFTQQRVITQNGVQIGQYGEIKSVIARDRIYFGADCKVYGYISSETEAVCCPDADWPLLDEEEEARLLQESLKRTKKSQVLPVTQRAVFRDAEEFDQMSAEVFRKNPHLTEAIIPEGVRCIRASFFYQCPQLKRVSLPSTLEEIEAYAFWGCSSLQEINLGECRRLRRIGESAFAGCSSLREAVLPPSIAQIDSAAFMDCSSLRRLSFPAACALTALPGHILLGCSRLEALDLPEGLTAVGMSAFYGCQSLTALTLPASVTAIGGFAFSGCSGLRALTIPAGQLTAEPNLLKGLPADTRLIVPSTEVREKLENLRKEE